MPLVIRGRDGARVARPDLRLLTGARSSPGARHRTSCPSNRTTRESRLGPDLLTQTHRGLLAVVDGDCTLTKALSPRSRSRAT
jgi:hypothetical protein